MRDSGTGASGLRDSKRNDTWTCGLGDSGTWTQGLMDSEKCGLGYVGLGDVGLRGMWTQEHRHVVTRGQKDKGSREHHLPIFVPNV